MEATNAAVLGDSYSSGEGSDDWIPPTGDGNFQPGDPNTCHRSHQAYALTVLHTDIFLACSGSPTDQIEQGARGEGPQVVVDASRQANTLGPDVKTVVLSAGGDDGGFASILTSCTGYVGDANFNISSLPVLGKLVDDSRCGAQIDEALSAFKTDQLSDKLLRLYRLTLADAPNAHLYVVGYPLLFPPGGHEGCNGIRANNQVRLNEGTIALNEILRSAVYLLNTRTRHLHRPQRLPGQHRGPRRHWHPAQDRPIPDHHHHC